MSTSISMLGEADLMALDEDLQEVPWGAVNGEAEPGGGIRILSPLAAFGACLARCAARTALHAPCEVGYDDAIHLRPREFPPPHAPPVPLPPSALSAPRHDRPSALRDLSQPKRNR